ncbi:hypothetical protein B0H14DRAFT_3465100 [Mycena olivaceomarginata]|nr:hypothetical protein B0H14DRAFT_3465100 [Mycena olivaceomarginata]
MTQINRRRSRIIATLEFIPAHNAPTIPSHPNTPRTDTIPKRIFSLSSLSPTYHASQHPYLPFIHTPPLAHPVSRSLIPADICPNPRIIAEHSLPPKRAHKARAGNEIPPSVYRPHVPADRRVLLWTSPHSIAVHNRLANVNISVDLQAKIYEGLLRATTEPTRETYGAGLLRFQQFCDRNGVGEGARMPADRLLLAAFIAEALGTCSGKFLLTARSLDEALNSVWTLLATSFGPTTIIVTDLVWLANCAIFMALATYNRHPHGSPAVQYTAIAQMYLSMAEILYLWARAPTLDAEFDETRDCGATRGYAVVAAIFLSRRLAGTLKQGEKMSLDPHLITLILVPYVVTVGSTELQIRKNQLCPDNVFWGFGQILAITVTIVPVFGTVQAFRKYGQRQSAHDLALSLDLRPSATTTTTTTTNTLQSTLSHTNLYPTLSSIHIFAYQTRPLPARFIANN